jgi:hypothetical protein
MFNRKRRAIIATAPDGGLLTARIADPPGCLGRVRAFARRWAGRVLWVGVGFVAGCTYQSMVR